MERKLGISAENSSEVAPAPPGQPLGGEKSACLLPSLGQKDSHLSPHVLPGSLTVPGGGKPSLCGSSHSDSPVRMLSFTTRGG